MPYFSGMKKLLFISALFLIELSGFSQHLVEDGIDKFTKDTVKRTSEEPLTFKMKLHSGYQFLKVNSQYYIHFKINLDRVFSISDGNKIMLMNEKEEVLTILFSGDAVSTIGGGRTVMGFQDQWGVSSLIPLSIEEMKWLKNNSIKTIRVYTNDGYIDCDVTFSKNMLLKSALALIYK